MVPHLLAHPAHPCINVPHVQWCTDCLIPTIVLLIFVQTNIGEFFLLFGAVEIALSYSIIRTIILPVNLL